MGAQALEEANKRMDRMADVLEKGLLAMAASAPAAPTTPTCHDHAPATEQSSAGTDSHHSGCHS